MSEHAALLQIDIVDSTKLGEALGDAAMSALWTEHDRLARDLLRQLRGREIDKSDGFLLLFEDPDGAASYALEYHKELARLRPGLQARAGLHVGPIVRRETPSSDVALGAKPLEIDGASKPLVARVMSLAAGGQTLMTQAAREAVSAVGREVVSHGYWRLKGFAEPVQVHEIAEPGRAMPPPADSDKAYCVVRSGELWVPRRDVGTNLPAQRDAFIGRRSSLRRLATHLAADVRLTSIVGTAGVGKTRLAIQCARSWLGEFPGGVWFCDLSQVRTLEGIHFAVARALDVPLGKDPAAQLRDAIAGRGRCLLVLDNFEQVVGHARETVGAWMDGAPQAVFLITTREVLWLNGERVFHLEPLEVAEAVELFAERARAMDADPSALDSDEGRRTIERLARLLEGLPLAIELAAARMRVMSPKTLLARIDERFKLLSSRGGHVDRQATLKTAFDWSWELLTPDERATLAQVSVFVSGFRLEAAEAVVVLEEGSSAWLTDLVHSLVDKSLVRQAAGDRFDLLESLREYAGEHLRTYGPDAAAQAELRHGSYFASRSFEGAGLETLAETGNVVLSCRRALARGDAATSAAAAINAWELLQMRGPYGLGLQLAEAALEMEHPVAVRARLQVIRGRVLLMCGMGTRARPSLLEALEGARSIDAPELTGRALAALAENDIFEARMDDAKANYEASLEISRAIGHVALECATLNGLGIVNNNLGLLTEAQVNFREALALARRTGQLRWESGAVGNLGQVLGNVGLADEALSMLTLAVETALRAGDRLWEGNMLCNLGLLLHERKDEAGAIANLERALVISREIGFPGLESVVLCNLGIVRAASGQAAIAEEAYDAALVIARQRADRRCEGQFLGYLGLLHTRCGRTDEARSCLLLAEQILRDVRDRVSLAIVLCARAETEMTAANGSVATALLEEATAIAVASGVESTSELSTSLARAKDRLAGPAVTAATFP